MDIFTVEKIATLLRRDVIEMTTAAGSGHPTSCLSAADIVATLFFSHMRYDTSNPHNPDNDEFVLSKGHAAPLLYAALQRAGCIKEDLKKLRTSKSSLEGHPLPSSLPWVKVATGSLGQGLGVAAGLALANKLQKRKARVFVLMGDSEVAEGSVFEALSFAGHYTLNNLIAFIDVNGLGQRGSTQLGHDTSTLTKRFEGFGWKVLSIDGHNVKEILLALHKADHGKQPTLILASTLKGKGVDFLEDKLDWHGKTLSKEQAVMALAQLPRYESPSFSIKKPHKTPSFTHKKKVALPQYTAFTATRKAYGQTLASLVNSDSNVLVLDAEVSNSTYANLAQKEKPKQFIETFIAEQNMVSVACGLATKGYHVYASTFAAFLTRAYDQLRMASLSSLNFVVCGSHAGVSIGQDGASQMGLEDIAMMRALPNTIVLYPCDAVSTTKLTSQAKSQKGITYIRTTRADTPLLYTQKDTFPVGEFKVLRSSPHDKAVLIGSGITTIQALIAYYALREKGIAVAVIDLYCIKPFNHKKLNTFVKKHGNKIVLAEDHRKEGGIGEMVQSGLDSGIQCIHLAVEGIPHSATPSELLEKHGIDWKAYLKTMKFNS